jgi:hypothetical protein
MATPYTRLTDAEKIIPEPSGLLPSGEANFFDYASQGLTEGTKKFRSPTDDGTFIDSTVNNLYEAKPNSYLHPGSVNNSNDETVKNPLVKPTGLLFDGVIGDDENEINYLSNSQEHVYTGFTLINAYIHYMPNPNGGAGLMDKSPFFFNYNPLAGTTGQEYYKYGKPS